MTNAAHARLENFVTVPFPSAVRAEVLRIAEGTRVSPGEISQLNFRLGRAFGEAALRACRKFRVHPRRLSVIGSHGQTIFHQGAPSRFLGENISSTLQIGEPAVIAAITGVTTVGDFRPADMAVGGQGAPLVPFGDYLLYRDPRRGRAVLNIGGIANVTIIPKAASPHSVIAFDTGPGNMVIDALVHHFTHGRRSFDAEAQMASRGHLLPALVEFSVRRKIFSASLRPRRAGREQYGKAYVEKYLAWGRRHRARPEDLVRTATIVTALSIADALHRWVPAANVTLATHRFRRRRAQSADPRAALRRSRRNRSGHYAKRWACPATPRKHSSSPCWPTKPCTAAPRICPAPPALAAPPSSAKSAIPRPANPVLGHSERSIPDLLFSGNRLCDFRRDAQSKNPSSIPFLVRILWKTKLVKTDAD